ncbi:MAG: enoyl-CoA hydratase/isomerase family protein [Bdellovibrionales bacterium]|nr:enoyl-CoA hydratase/isomerase family protein [Bdellovibrionales bacterium]
MNYSDIKFFVNDQGVAFLTLNRPSVLNSFRLEMSVECQAALEECGRSTQVRAVVLTGEGRAFCAGQDLSVLDYSAGKTPDLESIVRQTYNPLIASIQAIEKPVIAYVNGVAAGAGVNLALNCDVVIACESASFVQAFGQVGLIPDSGGTYILPRLIGEARAKALMITGEKLTATQAETWGMIYKALPDEQARGYVEDFAAKLASSATFSISCVKRALKVSWGNTLEDQLNLEAVLQGEAGRTDDHQEGVVAFLEKRKARFQGR